MMSRVYSDLNQRLLNRRQGFVLLVILLLAVLPHFVHLAVSISLFFCGVLLFRFITAYLLQSEHPRWMNFVLLLAGIGLVVINYSGSVGKDFGVSMLVAMLGLKVLEVRNYRDAYVLIFLTGFTLVTQFLYNQEIFIFVYIFSIALVLLVFLLWLNQISSRFDFRQLLPQALKLTLQALPVMLVLFVFFPRLQGPLWGFTGDDGLAVSGISGKITPGSISQLIQSSETAFRVSFEDPQQLPPPNQRYWRGPVINRTDGFNWNNRERPRAADPGFQALGEPIAYQVTMENNRQHWVFALDLPIEIPAETVMTSSYTVRSKEKINSRVTFAFVSTTQYIADEMTPEQRESSLQLPANITPRMRELVARLQQRNPDQAGYIQSTLDYFNQENFIYTLSPPELKNNPADEFLFESRKGFCEHYATSFVLLMRLAGIPSRVVAGYQGGEWNPTGNYLIVRQSDAHAWAEVWLDGTGWMRVDPTSAVSPERIENSINNAVTGDDSAVVFRVPSHGLVGNLLREAGWLADSMELNWHRWVVGFSQERQRFFLDSSGLDFLEGYRLGLGAIVLASVVIIIMVLLFMGRRVDPRDEERRIWDRFLRKLHKAGFEWHPSDGPQTILDKASKQFPAQLNRLESITALYIQLRYGRSREENGLQRFRQLVSQFNPR